MLGEKEGSGFWWFGVVFLFLSFFHCPQTWREKKENLNMSLIFSGNINGICATVCGCGTQRSSDVMIGADSRAHVSVNIWTVTSGWSEVRHAGSGLNRLLSDSCLMEFEI